MTDVTESRINIQEEEVNFRAAVSEGTFKRIGSSINFINLRQYDSHAFNLNGSYVLGVGSTGLDGLFTFLFDVELTGFSYGIGNPGSSSSTIVDIHRITGGDTDAGSIFTTRPEVASTAGSGTVTIYREVDSTTLALPTGHTLAVLNTTLFDAGDALRFDLDQAMSEAEDFFFRIFFRPR